MTTETTADANGVGLGRGGRMSRQHKREAVLRLLRGEDLELVSRSLGVTAATLSGWREAFLAAGEASLATRPTDGEALESARLKARLGEMLLERELLAAKIAALEAMSRTASPGSGTAYGLARVCRVWRTTRATVYRHRSPAPADPPRRRGPSGSLPDTALVEAIRAVLCGSPFHGEGHRKVWA